MIAKKNEYMIVFIRFDLMLAQKYQILYLHTTTCKFILTQKKLYKKTNAIFSVYGKNGIIPWHFFWILT